MKRDEVISQDPDRDTYVEPDSEVDFVVSSGSAAGRGPVGGRHEEERRPDGSWRSRTSRSCWRSGSPTSRRARSSRPIPAPASRCPQGSTVTVYYSDGPEEVPDVVGMQRGRGAASPGGRPGSPRCGCSPTASRPTSRPGTVLEQTPEAGTEQPADTQIVLIVTSYVAPDGESRHPPTVASPTDSPSAPDAVTGRAGQRSVTVACVGFGQRRRTPARCSTGGVSTCQPTAIVGCGRLLAVDREVVVVVDAPAASEAWSPTARDDVGLRRRGRRRAGPRCPRT